MERFVTSNCAIVGGFGSASDLQSPELPTGQSTFNSRDSQAACQGGQCPAINRRLKIIAAIPEQPLTEEILTHRVCKAVRRLGHQRAARRIKQPGQSSTHSGQYSAPHEL